jgi:type VI secretion system protein
MRVELTTIQPIENNPVKFSVNVDDALARLFLPANNAFMPAEQAFIETFDDIKIHQVAVLAGVQSSLKHIFRRFNPEKLLIKLEKQNPIGAKIPIHRQAKLWSLFEDLYSTIGEEAADDFQQLFGLEFSRAYEEQIEQLELSLMLKNK